MGARHSRCGSPAASSSISWVIAVNESAPYDRIGREIITQMAADELSLPFWMVYDDREGIVPRQGDQRLHGRDRQLPAGRIVAPAETLADLAEAIGVPAANLVETVARYNAWSPTAPTDFGRGDEAYDCAFSEGKPPLVPIDQPPFHAAAFGLSDPRNEGGGLRADTHARVLDESDRPIPGLYAAGNTMAAVRTGVSRRWKPIGASMLFSHLAALDMAGQPRGERCRHTGRPRARPNALHAVDRRGSPVCRCRHPQRSRPRKHMCSTSTGRGSGGSACAPEHAGLIPVRPTTDGGTAAWGMRRSACGTPSPRRWSSTTTGHGSTPMSNSGPPMKVHPATSMAECAH